MLAIDGIVPGSLIANDVEELAEAGFGPRLRVLATTDDVGGLLTGVNGRDRTAIADDTVVVEVEPLKQVEFQKAREALAAHRVGFVKGADFASEYRAPWLLRALLADIARDQRRADHGVLLDSSLGVWFVDTIRRRFRGLADANHGYRLLARDFVADTSMVSSELALEMSHGFVVRRDALQQQAREVIDSLTSQGWLTTYRHAGGEDVIVPCAPDLFLSEVANAMSEELERRVAIKPRKAGQWLADRLEAVFLGDVIGAQAIRDLATRQGGFPSGILTGLHDRKPTVKVINSGVIAFQRGDGTLQDLRINGDGSATLLDKSGREIGEPFDLDDVYSEMRGNMAGWMILAQLARVPAAIGDDDRPQIGASILLEIGTCSYPLMRPSRDPAGHLVHDVPGHGSVLCPDNGVIEPTTAAMQQLFAQQWESSDSWFDEAISKKSLPLLNRVLIALRQVRQVSSGARKEWARAVLKERIDPAIAAILKSTKATKLSSHGPRKRKVSLKHRRT